MQIPNTADLVADFLAKGNKITVCECRAPTASDGKDFVHTRQAVKDNRRSKK